jgi:hypothetical protein
MIAGSCDGQPALRGEPEAALESFMIDLARSQTGAITIRGRAGQECTRCLRRSTEKPKWSFLTTCTA